MRIARDQALADYYAACCTLTADQRNAVTAVLTSGRVVDTVVGAAGTGKTTTLRAVARAWLLFHPCEVLALAPSATAAHVLGDAFGVRAETTAKWLFETQERPATSAS